MAIWRHVCSSEETRLLGCKISNPGSATNYSSTSGRKKTLLNKGVLISKWFCFKIQDSWGVALCRSVGTDVLMDSRACLDFPFAKTNASCPSATSVTRTRRHTPDKVSLFLIHYVTKLSELTWELQKLPGWADGTQTKINSSEIT